MPLAEPPPALWHTGLYGKLPSQGDFVSRRLPQDFIGPWDDWLQAGMTESRGRLDGSWERAYQDAPVWRFVLASGRCGAGAWAGVMQPSVDRVGRYFPLTVAARLTDDSDPLATLLQCAEWHDSIEKVAETAFDASTAIEELDQRVSCLGFPPGCAAASGTSGDETLPLRARTVGAVSIPLGAGDSPQTLRALLASRSITPASHLCAWLSRGTSVVEPALLLTRSLPSANQFCALLVGRWQAHGWDVLDRS